MRKFLPIFLTIFFFVITAINPLSTAYATLPPPTAVPTGGLWVVDPEVTFIGKNAARSGNTLDWTLKNYQWACVTKVGDRNCDNSGNPLQAFWWTIVLWIVLPLLILVILATSMIIIVTRGKSLTIMRFVPRFTAVLILIALSYALLQFLYQFTDLIQGFFLRSGTTPCPPDCISQTDLLYVGWKYEQFVGLRLLGDYNAESAFISLLLTKLTALTYYVMVGILLIRKIILWFFIIVSPIFPILLLFYPVRNTGKIWIGEFFRWLLYGPLFAIFLQGLVFMWRGGNGNGQGIPLQFANPAIQDPTKIIYPTAVNILLGGPRQFVTPTNSVNLTETFMLYVVALIMLWIVILLPWILLQIFLEYAAQFSGDNAMMKNLIAIVGNKMVPPTGPAGHPPATGGVALPLPFTKKQVNIPMMTTPLMQPPAGAAKEVNIEAQSVGIGVGNANPVMMQGQAQIQGMGTYIMPSAQINAEVISFANMPLPTMRDIARYDSALLSNNASQREEVTQMQRMLERIGNPVAVTSTIERERYANMNERLVRESQQGNFIATNILNAVHSAATKSASSQFSNIAQATDSHLRNILQQIANPALASNLVDRSRMTELHDMLSRESKENNNQLASSILSVSDKTTANELSNIRDQLVKEREAGKQVSSILSNTIEASQIKGVLLHVANPASVSNATDRAKMTKLHDMLSRESKENNNQLASSILQVKDTTTQAELEKISEKLQQTKDSTMSSQLLSSINSSLQKAQNMEKTKSVLQQIAAPASITNAVEREKMSKLHDMLARESKENNNQLASSILQVKDSTTQAELEKISEKLQQTKESTMSSQILSSINSNVQKAQNMTQIKSVLQQIASPTSASAVNKEKMSKLHEALTQESQKGNELAKSLLSVNKSTSSADIEKLSEKLRDAKEKGQPLATDILTAAAETASIPTTNRIQSVTPEELQEVKQMWKENYSNMEVPEGMAGTRSEWVRDDIEKINTITGMLTSQDQEKVNQGISEVGNLLPFLLVGGFSQAEIVSYLQAKQEAAKEVMSAISAEEESKVSIETKKAETVQAMHVTVEAPSVQISTPSVEAATIVTPQVSNEILAMVNLKMPKMRDVARFDSMSMSRDRSQVVEVQKVRETLEKIANPSSVSVTTEKAKFEKLRDKLMEESEKGNVTAGIVLNAANSALSRAAFTSIQASDVKTVLTQISNPSTISSESEREAFTKLHDTLVSEAKDKKNELANTILSVSDTTTNADLQKIQDQLEKAQVQGNVLATSVVSTVNKSVETNKTRQVFQQIANPASIKSPVDRERMTKLHDSISKAGESGNELAASVLSVNKSTTNADIEKLTEKLKQAQLSGESIATSVMNAVPQAVSLPTTNRIQSVTPEELQEVKQMWKENYSNMEVPEGMAGTRSEWVRDDIEKINTITGMLTSQDQEKVNQGISEVGNLLPFLLVGGFSQAEIVSYLQAKQEAAKEVMSAISAEEESKVSIETKKAETVQAMHVTVEAPSVQISTPSVEAATIVTPQVSNEILAMVNLKMPKMRDVARFDSMSMSRDRSQVVEVQKVRETLEKIANPSSVSVTTEKAKFEKLRDKLMEESEKGNVTAGIVLNAANSALSRAAFTSIQASDVKTVLTQISNPSTISSESEREAFTKLHDTLVSEAKDKKNELANTILSVSDTTTNADLQKIQDQLEKAQVQGNVLATSVVSTVNKSVQTNKTRQVLQQIANPASVTATADRERMTRLHDSITKAGQEGSELATSLLSVNKATTNADIEKLSSKLKESQLKGESIAADVLSAIPQVVSLPVTNRIQTVTPEELQEVRQMWKENYTKMEVPEGMAGTRIEWIKDDIEKIDNITGMLTSSDQEKVNQGITEVSNLLPFLLVGGFSQAEIVSYLQAKQEAAKEVLESITSEEETKVSVETKKAEVNVMEAKIEAPSVEISGPTIETATIVTPQVSNEILAMVNLKIPTMKDIVRFEALALNKDKSKFAEVQKSHEILYNLAAPSKIEIPVDRQSVERLRERLIEESQKGNTTAETILTAAMQTSQSQILAPVSITQLRTLLEQFAAPALVTNPDEQEQFKEIHDKLERESRDNNNELAASILNINDSTETSEIEKIRENLITGQQKGLQLAQNMVSTINNIFQISQIKKTLQQIANPAGISSPINKARFGKLHDELVKAGKAGDKLAQSLLDIKEETKNKEIEKLKNDLSDAVKQKNPLAKSVVSALGSAAVPSDNRLQPVTDKDLEEIEKMWEEYYRTLPVPFGFNDDKNGRIEWITKDVEDIQDTLDLMQDEDQDNKNEGLQKVGTILPFLLLGGFSYQEIMDYLNAKLTAARTVLVELKTGGEAEEVDVVSKNKKEPKAISD